MTNPLDSIKAVNTDAPGIPPEQSCSANGLLHICISEKDSPRRRFLQLAMSGTLTTW